MTGEERINLLKCTLTGAIGFGVGGAVSGVFDGINAGNFAVGVRSIIWSVFGMTIGSILVNIIGGALLGAIGGVSLGLISKNAKKTLQLSLLGAIGFGIGCAIWNWGGFQIIGILLAYMGLSLIGYILGILVGFFIGGTIGGILLNSIYRERKGTLAFYSAVGFGFGGFLGIVIASAFFVGIEGFIIKGAIIGVVGGASLGAGVYLIQNQPAEKRG